MTSGVTDTSVFDTTFTFAAQISPDVRDRVQDFKVKYVLVSQKQ
jgi:hypothetical protein